MIGQQDEIGSLRPASSLMFRFLATDAASSCCRITRNKVVAERLLQPLSAREANATTPPHYTA